MSESLDTPHGEGAAILAANELFVCRASGEGSHNFRVCADEAGVIAFYDEMFGKDLDGTLDSAIKHLRDEDNWSNACTAYHCELYCATFEVWKVDRSEIAVASSEKEPLAKLEKLMLGADGMDVDICSPGNHGGRGCDADRWLVTLMPADGQNIREFFGNTLAEAIHYATL